MSMSVQLMEAARSGITHVLKRLLDEGADVEQKDEDGNTLIHLASWKGHKRCVKLLLNRGVNIESRGRRNRTPLLLAALGGKIGTMSLLCNKGANKKCQDNQNNTALHLAVYSGTPDAVGWLLSNGFDIESLGFCGRTPLLSAASEGKTGTMQLLLNKGANREHKDNNKCTALHLAAKYGTPDSVDLLLRRGLHLESRELRGRTLLLSAASGGKIGNMRLLLEKGANKEHKDNQNETALHLAARYGKPDSVDLLLSKGFHLESRGWNDSTPLISAAANGRVDNVRALLNRGASITCTNRIGKSALDLARGHFEVFNILAGASYPNVLMTKLSLDEIKEIYPNTVGGYNLNLANPMATQGGFGKVYQGIRTSDKRCVVLKQRVYGVNEETSTGHPHLEAKAMRRIGQHKNIIQFMGSIETSPGTVYLITEYCNIGSLTACLTEMKPKLPIKIDWMLQIAEGLNFMHSRTTPVAHRDLKPDNILAHREDGKMTMKLADFGFAKLVKTLDLTTICGTAKFMAPEVTAVHGCVKYGIASDIYSLGLVYSVMLRFVPSKQQLVPALEGLQLTGVQTVASIMRDRYKANQPVPALFAIHESDTFVEQRLKHLILTMARLKPDNRITIDIVLYELQHLSAHPLLK